MTINSRLCFVKSIIFEPWTKTQIIFVLFLIIHLNTYSCEKSLDENSNREVIELNEVEIDWQLNDFAQDDPILIKILREYYISYPTELQRTITPYRLNPSYIYGQFRQADVVDRYYSGSKYGGFFIEAGAHDGIGGSNTLRFELNPLWSGLLVEPNPKVTI